MTPYTSENTQVEENPPEKRLNLEVSQNGKVEVNKDENCCIVCCYDCCDCFCDCLYTFFCCDCDCCKSQDCKECCEGCLACLAVLGAICECIGAVCSIFAAFSWLLLLNLLVKKLMYIILIFFINLVFYIVL